MPIPLSLRALTRRAAPVPSTDQNRAKPASLAEIWRLAWPQTLMMLLHFLIMFTDVYVAGKISKDVQAALGLITTTNFMLLVVGIGLANGGVAAIGQSLGAGKKERAKRFTGLLLASGILGGLLLLGLGLITREGILTLLQTPESVRPAALTILTIYLFSLPPHYLLVVTNGIFRANGLVLFPLGAMAIIAVANIFLDFGLGLGRFGLPNLGTAGLAYATLVSVFCGAAYNAYILRGKGLFGTRILPSWRWVAGGGFYLFKVAWPSGLMSFLMQVGYLGIFSIAGSLPLPAESAVASMAGLAAGLRIESLLFLPGFALNMTASILVGHMLGAGKKDEAKRTGMRILVYGTAVMGILAVLLWQAADEVAAFISPEPEVQAQIVSYLAYNLPGIPFTIGTFVLGGVMIGAGATLYNMLVFGGATILVRLPLAYLLGHVILVSSTGIWLAMLLSQAFQCLVLLYLFQFKDWTRFALRSRRGQAASKP